MGDYGMAGLKLLVNLNVFPVRILECVSCKYSDTCFMYVYLNVFHVCIIECVSYWLLVFYRRSWLHDIIAMPHTGTLALGFML